LFQVLIFKDLSEQESEDLNRSCLNHWTLALKCSLGKDRFQIWIAQKDIESALSLAHLAVGIVKSTESLVEEAKH
jgi:hypothetical protein